jgi:DNA-binding response OmpR family regulator
MTKIMVVDDDSYQTYTIKKSLERMEETYEVIRADGGKQCLELLNQGVIPDIILLDVMMPDVSGWLTFDAIRDNKNWKNIPIIFITARTDKIAKGAGRFMGEDFIEKPFKMDILNERIKNILNGKK